MEILIVLILFSTLVYCANILYLVFGFFKIKSFTINEIVPQTRFTIVVPFRNEAQNLPKLLHSISLLDYPKDLFEVILVDDESSVKFQIPKVSFQIQTINNKRISNSPKKDAINTAINIANFEWIITTDADCIVQPKWLKTFDSFIQSENPKMIAAGVFYATDNSFLQAFQQLDLLSLQGTTIGSFGNKNAFMCNGANFCYQKTFFHELNGFNGNANIASGDDVFLLQKGILKDKKNVHFLKCETALVKTKPENSWKNLFFQRVRWASKTGNYSNLYSKQLGISVLLFNGIVILLLLLFILGLVDFSFFVIIFSVKFLVDYLLLLKTSSFFKTKLHYLLLGSLLYPIFSFCVGIYSIFGGYSWKGRYFKK